MIIINNECVTPVFGTNKYEQIDYITLLEII